jgi:glucose/arabinose dehydrogenase
MASSPPRSAGVPEVFDVSQGGLLDVALAPDFADSRVIYLSFAKPLLHDALRHRRHPRDPVRGPPASPTSPRSSNRIAPSRVPIHFGSRVVPDPDGTVWITTGERGGTPGLRGLAQDVSDHLRRGRARHDRRRARPGNPFLDDPGAAPERVTLGQRNIQGAALAPVTGSSGPSNTGPQAEMS